MKANRFLLLRTLTRTAPSLSSQTPLHFSSAAPKSSAPKSTAYTPKKKWKMFAVDTPPAAKSQPPKTIQLREDIRNSASFVGTVTGPVQRIHAPGGRVGACASLLVKGSSDDNCSFKILLKMWDETAEICLEHIKQNDSLHVSGRVESSYTKTGENEKSQTCCEVIVKEINYVAESEHVPVDKNVGLSESGESENISIDTSDGESEHSPINKNTGKSEHSPINKTAGKSEPGGVSGLEKHKARLLLWQRFFTNPSEWNDNRTKKLNPKSPDFKHKVSGEALWIKDFDSPWLEEKLQQLDSKLVAQDHKPPTESEYISTDMSAGESEHSPISKSDGKSDSGGVYGLDRHKVRLRLWQQFFANPSEWSDHRTNKSKPGYPDFKHKESGEALWVNDYDPPWLKEKLQQLGSEHVAQDHKPPTGESFSQHPSESSRQHPSESLKQNPNESLRDKPGESLSLRQHPSESSRQQSGESGLEKHRARLRLWQTFFTNPTKWYDNRYEKKNPKQPDFKHKESGEGLWINPRDPPWVQVQLQQLDSKPAKQDLK